MSVIRISMVVPYVRMILISRCLESINAWKMSGCPCARRSASIHNRIRNALSELTVTKGYGHMLQQKISIFKSEAVGLRW